MAHSGTSDILLAAVEVGDPHLRPRPMEKALVIRTIARPAEGLHLFGHGFKQSCPDALPKQLAEQIRDFPFFALQVSVVPSTVATSLPASVHSGHI